MNIPLLKNKMLPFRVAFFISGFMILSLILNCRQKPANLLSNDLKIALSPDSTQILIKGIDPYILKEINADSLPQKDWQKLMAVYLKVEEDVQDLQPPIAGNYSLKKEVIMFRPDKPFGKGRQYLVEVYLQNPNREVTEKLKRGNTLFNTKPISKEISF